VAVFAGDKQATHDFARQTGLPACVLLIPDPRMEVTGSYGAESCPRAFVFDRHGILRYTNNSKDDLPQGHDEQRIAFKALQGIRADDKPGVGHAR
jgi:nuclear transport factor 2 (NTF2) superfamily protein